MEKLVEKIEETSKFLAGRGISDPEVAIILGTGMGQFENLVANKQVISYRDIPHFPVSTVEFHKGHLIWGMLEGKRVLVMSGRFHLYEGYTIQQVSFPVRVMKQLGIRWLLISNAGGSMNRAFHKGSLMLLDDHINLLGVNPLIGMNHNQLGPRFPDMSRPYSPELNKKLEMIAWRNHITLHNGIYVAVPGPNLETRAEYRFLRTIGADVVGMSTIPEVIVANHAGLPCAAISVITDECDPDNLQPADISDILTTAAVAEKDVMVLFQQLLKEL